MAFNRKRYAGQNKPLKVTLKAGEEISLCYKPNFLTGSTVGVRSRTSRLREFEVEVPDETAELGYRLEKRMLAANPTVEDVYNENVEDTLMMLSSLEEEDDKGSIKQLEKEKEMESLLRTLSIGDLQLIQQAIRDDLQAPLEPTGTDSSAG